MILPPYYSNPRHQLLPTYVPFRVVVKWTRDKDLIVSTDKTDTTRHLIKITNGNASPVQLKDVIMSPDYFDSLHVTITEYIANHPEVESILFPTDFVIEN